MKLSYRSRLRRSPRGGGMEKKALRAFFSIPPPARRSSPHGIDVVAQKIPFTPSSPYPLSRAAPPRTGLMLSRRRSPSRLLLHTSSRRRSSPHGIDVVAQKIPFTPSSPYPLSRT